MPLLNALPEPVESAVHFPGFCAFCSNSKGPHVDTGRDLPAGNGDFHMYVCRSCGRDIAKILGYVKGERADALDAASDRLTDAEKEREEAQTAATKMADALTAAKAEITRLERELESARNREHQLTFGLQQAGSRINEALVVNGG